MNTTKKEKNNRYLDSPYVIKTTGVEKQQPFSYKNHIKGNLIIQKEGFTEPPPKFLTSKQGDYFHNKKV